MIKFQGLTGSALLVNSNQIDRIVIIKKHFDLVKCFAEVNISVVCICASFYFKGQVV